MKSSNIGGQAVMEGVMMMNKDHYSVAVRRPDGEIEVKVEQHKPLTKHKGLLKVPILRGVFSFADSMTEYHIMLASAHFWYRQTASSFCPSQRA